MLNMEQQKYWRYVKYAFLCCYTAYFPDLPFVMIQALPTRYVFVRGKGSNSHSISDALQEICIAPARAGAICAPLCTKARPNRQHLLWECSSLCQGSWCPCSVNREPWLTPWSRRKVNTTSLFCTTMAHVLVQNMWQSPSGSADLGSQPSALVTNQGNNASLLFLSILKILSLQCCYFSLDWIRYNKTFWLRKAKSILGNRPLFRGSLDQTKYFYVT